jgi:hypothetical protein
MGLFTSDADDSKRGEEIIRVALKRFNSVSGAAYSVSAEVDSDNLEKCCAAFKRIKKLGFPDAPGPFKRLGAFAALAQAWSPFLVTPIHHTAEDPNFELIWGARLVVETLPGFAAVIELGGKTGHFIRNSLLPTPHFQVEFIAFLRAFANGSKRANKDPDDGLLLERSQAIALMLEAAAYVPANDPQNEQIFAKAAGCLALIADDELFLHDWKFNDPVFLDMALAWGIEG